METKTTPKIISKTGKETKTVNLIEVGSISLDNRIKKINYVVRGWVNYFRIANMKNKITEIDEHIRVRIRVIIWKQWKRYVRNVKAYKN